MKTYHIYSDTHYFAGKYEYPEEVVARENTVLLGDIVEIKNIKKKKKVIEKAVNKLLELKDKAKYVCGNHEVSVGYELLPKEIIIDGVLFVHGHQLKWSEEDVKRWEKKKPGVKWYVLAFQRVKRVNFKKGGPKTPKDSTIKNAVELAKKFDCHTIVYGHTHNSYDGMHDGIRVVNIDRGYTCINL